MKGIAEPSLIKLLQSQSTFAVPRQADIPLHITHRAVLSKDEIAPQRIDNHEYHLVERRMHFGSGLFLLAAIIFLAAFVGLAYNNVESWDLPDA